MTRLSWAAAILISAVVWYPNWLLASGVLALLLVLSFGIWPSRPAYRGGTPGTIRAIPRRSSWHIGAGVGAGRHGPFPFISLWRRIR